MNYSKLILACFLFAISMVSIATTPVATQARINLWTGSSAIADTNYTMGTTSALGVVKTLKNSTAVISSLGVLNTGNMYFSSKSFNGSQHQSISENGTTDAAGTSRQCVAFAKSMTGAGGTTTWSRGFSITSYVDAITRKLIPAPQLVLQGGQPLQAGSMIAYFDNQSKYPGSTGTGHVAIFLNWTYDPFIAGKITGMDVVDENLIWTVAINGVNTAGASGLIQKHWLPWSCTASGSLCSTDTRYKNPRYYSSNYHVVSTP